MSAQPWMKFHPQDWRADEKLRLCGLMARGLWIEMVAIMHRSERYGMLLIAGNTPNAAQLAVQVGAPVGEVEQGLSELENACVFSRSAKGIIYSRRMIRDKKKAETARETGKMGGNPKLCNKKQKPASDKGQLNGVHNAILIPRSQNAEDRGQIEPNGSLSSNDDTSEPAELRPEHVFEFYQEVAQQMGLPVPRDLTPERRQLIKGRITQYSLDDFHMVFANCRNSPFLRGDRGRTPLTADWLFKKGNFQKTLEGNYAS